MRTALLCLFLATLPRAEAAPVQTGQVIHITDGDTLTVRVDGKRRKLRLLGIDAPELEQPFGTRAKKILADLVFGREVRFESRTAGPVVFSRGGERVGRTPVAARVYLGQTEVAMELLSQGYAWVARHERGKLDLMEREREARAVRRGLWAGDGAIAPWDWRRREAKPEELKVFCTQEVKRCPDGSWVSRRPPGCAFAACPEAARE